jgi:predicted phage tail protein
MCANYKGFKQSIIDGGYYRVLLGGRTSLKEDEIHNPVSAKETIRLVPVAQGSGGDGSFFNIILGAVLVVVGTFVPGAQFLIPYGWAMIAGGVAQMLFAPGTPNSPNDNNPVENRASHSFNGAVNTVSQGNPVPVCYGRMMVGSQIISAGLYVEQT